MEYYIMVRKWRQAKYIELKIRSAYFKKKETERAKYITHNTDTYVIIIANTYWVLSSASPCCKGLTRIISLSPHNHLMR